MQEERASRRPSPLVRLVVSAAFVACTPSRDVGEEICPAVVVARGVPPAPSVPTGAPRIRFERPLDGELTVLVRTFAEAARAEGRTPLVYVGATWCEPCGYFHAAAERGDLDADLPPLALLELDLDRDAARLAAAGYSSRMIPLFVVPDATGRGSDRRIEGSIHGAGSPREILPRLLGLLARP